MTWYLLATKYWQNLGVSVHFSIPTGGSKAFNFSGLYYKIRKIYHDGLTYFKEFSTESQ